MGLCHNCGKPLTEGSHRLLTCSEECHHQLIDDLTKKFGEFKKVIDTETGKAHKVPTRDILESGIKGSDLHNYPFWDEEAS